MARRQVKSQRTLDHDFNYDKLREVAYRWNWEPEDPPDIKPTTSITPELQDKYDDAYDMFMVALQNGEVEKKYLDMIPKSFLIKERIKVGNPKPKRNSPTGPKGKGKAQIAKEQEKAKSNTKPPAPPAAAPKQTTSTAGSPPQTPPKPNEEKPQAKHNEPEETPSGLPIEETSPTEPKESKFKDFKSVMKRTGMNMLSSVLGSNPITSPIGSMIELHQDEIDAEERKNNKGNGKDKGEGKGKEKTEKKANGESVSPDSSNNDAILDQFDNLQDAVTSELKNVNDTAKEIVEGVSRVEEYAKTIATKSEAPLEKATDTVTHTVERITEPKRPGEKLTLAEKRARSAKFTEGMKELEEKREGLKDGAVTESPVKKQTSMLDSFKKNAAMALTTAKDNAGPIMKGLANNVTNAVKSGTTALTTGADSAKNKVSSLLAPKNTTAESVESKTEGSIKEGEDIAILKSIDENTKQTANAIVKMVDKSSKVSSKTEPEAKAEEQTASTTSIGDVIQTALDVKDALPGKAGEVAKGAGKASKLKSVLKMGGKALGVAGAAYDVYGGVNDLMEGKEQKEMPTGWDAVSPMKWGMYAGAKIREAGGGGKGGWLDNATDWIGDKITGNKISKWSQDDAAPVSGVAKNGAVPNEIDAAKAKGDQIAAAQANKASGGNISTTTNVTNNEATTQVSIRTYPRNQESTWNKVMEGKY